MNKKIFISYCWKDEKIVNKIDDYFLQKNIKIQRDKRTIESWGSIKEFMKSIRDCEISILVISSHYLKSTNCMYEVLEVMKDENYKNKILTIVLDDAKIYQPINRIEYIKYWQTKHSELEECIRSVNDFELTSKLSEELKKIREIMSNIDEFIALVSDMNNPVVNDDICDEINTKLTERGVLNVNDIDSYDSSTTFFYSRLGKAFPGVRGGQWFTISDGVVDKLDKLLREPLSGTSLSGPIWWFRGSSCMSIEHFEKVNSAKCIIEANECSIDKVYVYQSGSYYKSFVYVELKPENPIGIYEMTDKDIETQNKYFGYASEEYGLYKNTPITRAEFDDGAAVINNECIEFDEFPKILTRYLSKYNFIICAQFNPINSNEGDIGTERILKAILKGEAEIEDLVNFIERLPKKF